MKKNLHIVILLFLVCSCKEQSIQDNRIPFHYNGHVVLPGVVNDSLMADFILDVGSYYTLFDPTLASRLDYKNSIICKRTGASGDFQSIRIYDTTYIVIGKGEETFSYTTHHVGVSELVKAIGRHSMGLIGLQAVIDTVLEVNYEDCYVRVDSEMNHFDTRGYKVIPIVKSPARGSFDVYLRVYVTDEVCVSGLYKLDTGANIGIFFTKETVEKYGLDTLPLQKRVRQTEFLGLGGGGRSEIYTGNKLIIGEDTLYNPALANSLMENGALSYGKHYVGLIGNHILEHFNLIFDFSNNELYYKPNKYFDEPMVRPDMGFEYVNRTDVSDGWIVNSIYEGGKAYSAGLQCGDTIVRINGKKVTNITPRREGIRFFEVKTVSIRKELEEQTLAL